LNAQQLTINSLHTRAIFFYFYEVKIEREARNSLQCSHSIPLVEEEKSSPKLTSRKREKGEESTSGPVIYYVARTKWLNSVIDLV
jgi:hypothetical protein